MIIYLLASIIKTPINNFREIKDTIKIITHNALVDLKDYFTSQNNEPSSPDKEVKDHNIINDDDWLVIVGDSAP